MKIHREKGFTLVELLTVIAIIGILAGISIATYRNIQARSQAAAISEGLRQVGQSMNMWAMKKNLSTWPTDPVDGGGTPLSQMIASDPELQKVLQSVPDVKGVHTEEWFYDNEGDTKDVCTDPYDGVNIVIRFVNDPAVATMVDKTLDDGNFTCGRVRYVDERIFYALSNQQSVRSSY